MAGTKAGGLKAAQTNKLKYGDGFYGRIGRKGGQNGHTGGFAKNPALARQAGAKGGRSSVRGASLSVIRGESGELRQETVDIFKRFMTCVFKVDNEKFLSAKKVGWQLPPTFKNSQCYGLLQSYIYSDPEWSDDRVRLAMAVLFALREKASEARSYQAALAITEVKSMIVHASERSAITWRQAEYWYNNQDWHKAIKDAISH